MASLAASPTPLSGGYRELSHRPSRSTLSRAQTIRPNLRRGSPLLNGYGNDYRKDNSLGDSSDDEAPIPKLSAAAEELLGVVTGERPAAGGLLGSTSRARRTNESPLVRDGHGAQRILPRTQQTHSPPGSNAPSPRIVKISSGRPMSASLRRAIPIAGTYDGSPLGIRSKSDVKTPGSRPKSLISGSQTSPSALGHSFNAAPSSGSGMIGASTFYTSKNEEPAIQGSVRIKRLGKMSGSFLSGPARRGMIRRPSDESQAPYSSAENRLYEDEANEWASKPTKQSPSYLQQVSSINVEEKHNRKIYFDDIKASHQRSPSLLAAPKDIPVRRQDTKKDQERSVDPLRPTLASSLNKLSPPAFKPTKVPALSPRLDQENIPPPTFKRDKHIHEIISLQDRPRLTDIVNKIQHPMSPARKPLTTKPNNTPLRPAPPPPPKMSILETATAPAVSAAANAKRRPRNIISVNGKHFTRMECVGRGGSGKVFRVMADNFKLFAVKSVSLEDLDELTIRGFKGEIELLRKLQNVDRVVRLYDYEINEEKKVLRVLMDIGELDLKKILDPKLDEETGKLDITFTRYIWKEMLECVSAVHAYDIVHSDLKPANFVMMLGRLKLIDFGISNAIQNDTVNVHREHQVGTPNYMAPETLLDTNVHQNNHDNNNNNNKHTSSTSKNTAKLMKIGKPSDIWSLGCILYQITYGKPPFHHITNNMRKILAITDPSHSITFPVLGLGGTPVPTGLIRTLRKCLDRDASRRPTADQMLQAGDMFLHPDAPGTVPVSVELIGRLQHNIIQHVVAHGVPTEEELRAWPKWFFESIRAAVEEGRA